MTTIRQLCLACVLASTTYADQLTFSFVGLGTSTVTANASGMTMTASPSTTITDSTTGVSLPLSANDTASTGAASDFTISPGRLTATYNGDGPGSVLIKDLMGNILLSGTMSDNGKLLSSFPSGNGAFLSKFTLDFVAPSVLARFRLSSASPEGAFSTTFGSADLVGTQLEAQVGGGAITIQASTVVPEPNSFVLALGGCGLLGAVFVSRLERKRRRTVP